jgi:hypothetical protein
LPTQEKRCVPRPTESLFKKTATGSGHPCNTLAWLMIGR